MFKPAKELRIGDLAVWYCGETAKVFKVHSPPEIRPNGKYAVNFSCDESFFNLQFDGDRRVSVQSRK